MNWEEFSNYPDVENASIVTREFDGRRHQIIQALVITASGRRPLFVFSKNEELSDELLLEECRQELAAARMARPLEKPLRVPVIMSPWPASMFIHEVVGHSMEADNFEASQAFKLGTRASSLNFDVVDMPAHETDAENIPTRKKFLVREGMWNELLGTKAHVAKWGAVSGNARKVEAAARSLPRMATTFLDSTDTRRWSDVILDPYAWLCCGTWGGGGAGDRYVLRPSFARVIRYGRLTDEYISRFDIAGSKTEDLARLVDVVGKTEFFMPPFGCDKDDQKGLSVGFGSPYLFFEELEVRPISRSANVSA